MCQIQTVCLCLHRIWIECARAKCTGFILCKSGFSVPFFFSERTVYSAFILCQFDFDFDLICIHYMCRTGLLKATKPQSIHKGWKKWYCEYSISGSASSYHNIMNALTECVCVCVCLFSCNTFIFFLRQICNNFSCAHSDDTKSYVIQFHHFHLSCWCSPKVKEKSVCVCVNKRVKTCKLYVAKIMNRDVFNFII